MGKRGPPQIAWSENHRLAVSICVASGIPFDAIARGLGISVKTLERRFPNELKRGAMEIKMRMTTVLAQKALAGDVSAIRFYLGQRYAEWRMQNAEGKQVDLPDVVHFFLPDNHRHEPELVYEPAEPSPAQMPPPSEPRRVPGAPVVQLPLTSSWRKIAERG